MFNNIIRVVHWTLTHSQAEQLDPGVHFLEKAALFFSLYGVPTWIVIVTAHIEPRGTAVQQHYLILKQ